MRKSFLALLLIAVLLIPMANIGASAATQTTVSYTSPAIAVNAGDTVTLADYAYSDGTATISFADYTWSSDDATISDGKITVAEKGVYALTGKSGDKSINIYIVAKNKNDTEYVLYEEDFTSFEVSEYKINAGSASVKDGKLVLTANSVVLLPEYLGDFGDYKIEAVAAMTQAGEATRWFSFMHRIQNNTYPYYQMAIRQNATASNGVEFAERTVSSEWSVTHTASYSEKLSTTEYYTFTVCARGDIVSESINDTLLIFNKNASLYDKGRIGLQTNGSTMSLDSIKICLQLEDPQKPLTTSTFVDARMPQTNLITTPSMITVIDSAADLESILTSSPATAFAYVNAEGNILDASGTVLTDIAGYVEKLGKNVIAGFIPQDRDSVDAVCEYMTSSKLDDVSMLVDDKTLGKYIAAKKKNIRTMVTFAADYLTSNTLMDMRETVNGASSKTAVLPASLATKANVQYLQKLLINVWVVSDGEETEPSLLGLILSGANGIVVKDRATAEGCFTKYFDKNSLTRTIWQIGHRGVPSLAPENSIEGSVLAAENGANIIENDIYITTDGVIVVMHDGSIDRTSSGTGNIESMTYAKLQEATLDTVGGISGCKIPTLEQYFEEFKGTDTFIFIEIKSGNRKLVTELVRLVGEYDIADQISVISFNADQLVYLNSQAPYISTGYLCSGVTGTTDDIENVKLALKQTLNYNTTFNQSFSGMNEEFITELQNRGNTVWPWTFGGDKSAFLTYYLAGAHGLTTNNCQFLKSSMQFLYSDKYDYALDVGATEALDIRLKTYSDSVYALPEGNTVIVSGSDVITTDGKTLTALKSGEATFFCKYETEVCGKKVTITSQLFTVTVTDPTAPPAVSEDASTPSEGSDTPWLWIVIGAVVVLAAVVVFVIINRKKK